ncbi:MAG: hypothetical protein QRY74_03655 [Chlamydia sp.]
MRHIITKLFILLSLFSSISYGASSQSERFISVPETEDALPPAILESIILSNSRIEESMRVFDVEEITKKLIQLPCIERANVIQMENGELAIYHTMRRPILYIQKKEKNGLFSQALGCDAKGVCFSMTPWYSPKKLPSLLISGEELQREGEIGEIAAFIEALDSALNGPNTPYSSISFVDMTKIGHNFCYFQREVIVCLLIAPRSCSSEDCAILIRVHPSDMRKKLLFDLQKVLPYATQEVKEGSGHGVLDMRYTNFCLFSTIDQIDYSL